MSTASTTSPPNLPAPVGDQPALFELRAGPFVQGELRVLEFKGREALSKLFSFEIMFDSDLPAWELEAGLLGQPATLVMQARRYPPRVVHGTVAWVRVENAWKDDSAARRYTLRLVPTMWKLGKRVNTRIFQDQSVADVITTVMVESGLAVRFDLSAPLPLRDYCVQYHESDLAFVTRLLAEAGCYFYFEPPVGILEQLGLGAASSVASAAAAAGVGISMGVDVGTVAGVLGFVDTLVVSDRASFYPAIPFATEDEVIARGAGAVGNPVVSNLAGVAPTLVHRDPEGMNILDGERTVNRFALRRSLRSSAVMLRDYLYERPLFDAVGAADPSDLAAAARTLGTAALNDTGTALRGGASNSVGAAAFDMLATMPADFKPREVYRHQSDFFEADAQTPNAQRQLEQHRRKALSAEGKSLCRRLTSGHKFTLAEHEEERFNRVWVVTSVKHQGITIEWARLTGHGDERVLQYQNAFTCAPAELTIRPKRPPRRLVQVADTAVVVGPPGQEVYTDALGRIKVQFHWDRVGKKDDHSSCWIRVLHAWSGPNWGTQFTPRIGMEVLVLYHQGDPDKPVVIGCLPNTSTPQPFHLPDDATRSGLRTNTLPTNGGFNELSFEDRQGSEQIFLRAERDFDEVVQHDHTVNVGRDERETVGGDRYESVSGSHAAAVVGNHSFTVGGGQTLSVGGTRSARVAGDANTFISGQEMRNIGESAYLTTRGTYQMTISGGMHTVVGTHEESNDALTLVWGNSTLFTSGEIRLQSEKTIVLECGESRVTLTPTEVRIGGKAIVIDGHDSTSIFGKKPAMHLTDVVTLASDKVTVTAKGSSLELEANAELRGGKVKLVSGSSAKTEARKLDPAESKPFELKLLDPEHKPYANLEYHLMAGGMRFEGTTDGEGTLSLKVPKSAAMGDLTLWIDPPPTGRTLRWQVEIVEKMPPPDDPMGALLRLQNLGYARGDLASMAEHEVSDLLSVATTAMQLFQPDLPKDGALGGETLDWLKKLHDQ